MKTVYSREKSERRYPGGWHMMMGKEDKTRRKTFQRKVRHRLNRLLRTGTEDRAALLDPPGTCGWMTY